MGPCIPDLTEFWKCWFLSNKTILVDQRWLCNKTILMDPRLLSNKTTYGSKVAKQQGNSYVSKVAKQQGNPYRTMVSKQQNNPYGYVDGCYFHFEGQDFQLKKLNSFARAGNVVNACAVLRIQVPPLIAKLCNFCPSYD